MYFNQRNYSDVSYPSKSNPNATCSSSGCGAVSVCIVLDSYKDFEWFTVPEICKYSISHGCRVNSGTDVYSLLKCICSNQNGFSFTITDDIKKLKEHLNNKGMAVLNQGNNYKLFSTEGHFVAAMNINNDVVEIYDPYMYDGKYNTTFRKARVVSQSKYGCSVKLSEIDKACGDRRPRYYLISYDPNKDKTKKKSVVNNNFDVPVGKKVQLLYDMNVRDDNGNQKLRSQLTVDGKNHSYNQSYAVLKAGTICSVIGKKEDNKYKWIKIPSGWVAYYSKVNNKRYVKII